MTAVPAVPAAESALWAAAGSWAGLARLVAARKTARKAAAALLGSDRPAERSSGPWELAQGAAPLRKSPSSQRGAQSRLLHPPPGQSVAKYRGTAAPSPQRHSAQAAVSTDFGVRIHCCRQKPISLPKRPITAVQSHRTANHSLYTAMESLTPKGYQTAALLPISHPRGPGLMAILA